MTMEQALSAAQRRQRLRAAEVQAMAEDIIKAHPGDLLAQVNAAWAAMGTTIPSGMVDEVISRLEARRG